MKTIGIIATKNRYELLQKALDSALNQRVKLDKTIIVSDSNDENFAKETSLLKGLDCSLLRDRYTHNYAGNLNTAIDFVLTSCGDIEGTYIAFLDDDDYWDNDYVEKCLNALNGEDFVVAGLKCSSERGKENLSIPTSLTIDDFLKGNPGIQGSNTFIKLSTLLKAGCFDENMSSTTDRDLFTRVMKLNPRYVILNEYLVNVNNSNTRARITNTSSIKKDGLVKFYLKNSSLMSETIKEQFFARCSNIFHMTKEEFEDLKEKIVKEQEEEKLVIKENKFLEPNLFSSNHEFLWYLKNVCSYEKFDSWYKKYLEESKNMFDWVDELCSIPPIKDSISKSVIKLSLLGILDELIDMNIHRYVVYERYCEVADFLKAKLIRNSYAKQLHYDFGKITEETYNKAEIVGVIDATRHNIERKYTKVKFNENSKKILKELNLENYTVLGCGSEGFVFTDNKNIYKWFKNWDENLVNHLKFLGQKLINVKHSYGFEVMIIFNDLILKYPYTEAHDAKDFREKDLLELIEDFKDNDLVLDNVKSRNFVVDSKGLKYIDFGESILPFDEKIYEKSIFRAKDLAREYKKGDLYFYKVINESYMKRGM